MFTALLGGVILTYLGDEGRTRKLAKKVEGKRGKRKSKQQELALRPMGC